MNAPAPGHVLVIGVDGVRFDLLGPDGTPSIWELGQHGFLAPVPVDETTPTSSAQSSSKSSWTLTSRAASNNCPAIRPRPSLDPVMKTRDKGPPSMSRPGRT